MVTGQDLEIACDESGAEGENLTAAITDVFAHASVSMEIEAADDVIRVLRDRIRSPATEYKANHLLRGKHHPALGAGDRPRPPAARPGVHGHLPSGVP
ncbi:hypothetical protein AB0K48_22200, partial [Nonomuraea sp. NPDC055795]